MSKKAIEVQLPQPGEYLQEVGRETKRLELPKSRRFTPVEYLQPEGYTYIEAKSFRGETWYRYQDKNGVKWLLNSSQLSNRFLGKKRTVWLVISQKQ